ncbi:MAG: Rqc2 family fibronectin-binding protein [Bacillota bacterium]
MPFDGMVLAAITRELQNTLIGCRIDKIYQPAREEMHLILSRPGSKFRLLLSADPSSARVHITESTAENPPSPPVFCMVMRKHLEGGRISGFAQEGYDRILTISVDVRDELGRPSSRQINCEIMGKHSNIILCDPDTGIILDGIKRYSHAVSRHREVLPGRQYIAPPAQKKKIPLSIAEEYFFSLMLENELEEKLINIVQRNFDGLSPVMAREIINRAGLDPNTTLNNCGEYDLRSVYLALIDIYSRAEKGDFRPTVVFNRKGVREFAAFGLTHLDFLKEKTGGMNEISDIFFTQRSLEDKAGRIRQSILSVLRKEKGRLEKKLSLQYGDLESASEAENLKLYGELITANIHRLKKGETEVFLDNFYKEGCPPEKVVLDPQLTPAENAQFFFRKYTKAKKTGEAAAHNIQNTEEELQYISGVETCSELAAKVNELNEIREELTDQGYIKPTGVRAVKKRGQDQPRPSFYISSQGFNILVGKNNRQNDFLTMKMAREEDIWLHAREIPGSHVIIKTGGKNVPPQTLEEAASLAALFSRAGQSHKVPVDYTLRKYVNKPKGAKPGFVIYTDQKTIIAEPDPALPEKLSQGI